MVHLIQQRISHLIEIRVRVMSLHFLVSDITAVYSPDFLGQQASVQGVADRGLQRSLWLFRWKIT